jgi:hypothetical protein
MELSGQLHNPAALPPVPPGQKVVWASEWVWKQWWREKILYPPLTGIEPRSSSPHPSNYTDWATPAPKVKRTGRQNWRCWSSSSLFYQETKFCFPNSWTDRKWSQRQYTNWSRTCTLQRADRDLSNYCPFISTATWNHWKAKYRICTVCKN